MSHAELRALLQRNADDSEYARVMKAFEQIERALRRLQRRQDLITLDPAFASSETLLELLRHTERHHSSAYERTLEPGVLYGVNSRNLSVGALTTHDPTGLTGLRTKFGYQFLDTEILYSQGGTLTPLYRIGIINGQARRNVIDPVLRCHCGMRVKRTPQGKLRHTGRGTPCGRPSAFPQRHTFRKLALLSDQLINRCAYVINTEGRLRRKEQREQRA